MLRSLSEASAWHAFSSRINSLLYQTIELNYMSSKFQSAFFPWFCPGSLVCDLSASPICLGCWFHHVHNSMHWFHLVIAENYWSSPTMQNIYIFFFSLQTHFGLIFRILQDDFSYCSYWTLPKDRTPLLCVFTFKCDAFRSPRKLPAFCNYFLKFTSLFSLS